MLGFLIFIEIVTADFIPPTLFAYHSDTHTYIFAGTRL